MNTDNDFIDLREIVSVLRRQYRLIGLTLLIILAVAFLYLVRATPLYTATALIKIDPQETNLLDPTQIGNSNSSIESTRLETEVEILKSNSLALMTIQSLRLQETPEFGPSLSLTDKMKAAFGMELPPAPTGTALLNGTLGAFQDSLSVRRRGLTYIVAVQVTTPNPDQAALVANAHAQTYIQDQISSRTDSSIASRDVLQGQLEAARLRLAASNNNLRSYIEENVIRLADETGNVQLAEIGRELQDTSQQIAAFEVTVKAASAAVEAQDWSTLATQVGDDALLSLQRQREQLQRRLDAASTGSDEAFDLATGLANLEKEIADRGQQAFTALENQLENAQELRGTLLNDAQNTVLASELSADTLAEIYSLQQEAGISQRQYDQLLSRVRDLETQAVLQVANSRVVSEALVPNAPSYPNKKLVLALAMVMGLGIGVGLAFLKEFYFGGVTSANQLQNILNAPLGGVIPKVQNLDVGESLADRVITEPMSPFSESYRKLRASIDEEIPEQQRGTVILVTSAIPAEGKSTTALALARTYAAAGKQTLLIDADLRNPSIHGFLKSDPERGLLDYLIEYPAKKPDTEYSKERMSEVAEIEKFYVVDPLSNAGILLGRKKSNVPTDAPLQTQAFAELINGARNSFDVVIVDTAPLVPVVDTRYIAPQVDAAVLCVRFGEATQTEIRSTFDQLTKAMKGKGKVLTALSCFEGTGRSYKYAGYYN